MARVLITSALPYANGSIHLGHLVEHIQTDIYARFRRLIGDEVLYFCADDTHGTGIELNAKKAGITPEALVQRSWEEHTADFREMGISYDLYYTTNSDENRELSGFIYEKLKEKGHIERISTMQMFSENLGRFLPDRWVKGTCPYCKAPDQYGDQCESCARTYEPTDLINPVDAIEGKTPVLRETTQLYVRLSDFTAFLNEWVKDGVPQPSTRNFVERWLSSALENWCISRDAPYFGFEIPGEPGKFFYVWLDAPVGYVAATKKYCDDRGADWRTWWGPQSDAELIHVIGKDIVYFHALFWPAMLHAAELHPPTRVQAHGFLTVNGEKMSKSRGTFVRARTYLKHLDPSWLRYYIGAKLSTAIEDIDLNLTDFVDRVNAELVNNIVNLASRVTKFIGARFDGEVASFDPKDYRLAAEISEGLQDYRARMMDFDYRGALKRLNEVGDAANTFFQDAAPWAVIKEDPAKAAELCAVALHASTALMVGIAPLVPNVADIFAQGLGLEHLRWEHASAFWKPAKVVPPDRLIDRMDLARVEAMIEDERLSQASAAPETADAAADEDLEDFKGTISFDEFAKVDLRIGVIEEAGFVEGAKKLLQFKVNIGRTVQVFSGIRSAYPDPQVLVGKRVLCVANLAPRKMKFGVSEGMLLATSAKDDTGLQLVFGPDDAQPGWTVR